MYAIIDVETTGTGASYGKITEIAIILHNGMEVTESFSTLINPECNIPYNITRLTGITNEMVANAPKFYEVAKKIVELGHAKRKLAEIKLRQPLSELLITKLVDMDITLLFGMIMGWKRYMDISPRYW